MNVEALIKLLQKCDPKAIPYYDDSEYGSILIGDVIKEEGKVCLWEGPDGE